MMTESFMQALECRPLGQQDVPVLTHVNGVIRSWGRQPGAQAFLCEDQDLPRSLQEWAHLVLFAYLDHRDTRDRWRAPALRIEKETGLRTSIRDEHLVWVERLPGPSRQHLGRRDEVMIEPWQRHRDDQQRDHAHEPGGDAEAQTRAPCRQSGIAEETHPAENEKSDRRRGPARIDLRG